MNMEDMNMINCYIITIKPNSMTLKVFEHSVFSCEVLLSLKYETNS